MLTVCPWCRGSYDPCFLHHCYQPQVSHKPTVQERLVGRTIKSVDREVCTGYLYINMDDGSVVYVYPSGRVEYYWEEDVVTTKKVWKVEQV